MLKKKLVIFMLVLSIFTISNGTPFSLVTNSDTGVKKVYAATTMAYPSPWYPIEYATIYTSDSLQKSGKTILAGAILMLIPGGEAPALRNFGLVVAGVLLDRYFVNSDQQDIYLTIKYRYSILGPDKYDSMGNVIEDLLIEKSISAYTNFNRTDLISEMVTTYRTTSFGDLH
jgi:hypothetical protein